VNSSVLEFLLQRRCTFFIVFQNFTNSFTGKGKARFCRFQTTNYRNQATNNRIKNCSELNFALSNSTKYLMSDKNYFSNFLIIKK